MNREHIQIMKAFYEKLHSNVCAIFLVQKLALIVLSFVIFKKTSMNQYQTTMITDMTRTVVELERQIELQIYHHPKIRQFY